VLVIEPQQQRDENTCAACPVRTHHTASLTLQHASPGNTTSPSPSNEKHAAPSSTHPGFLKRNLIGPLKFLATVTITFEPISGLDKNTQNTS
jgi:hypothetical protein